jgi:hypothetical protein
MPKIKRGQEIAPFYKIKTNYYLLTNNRFIAVAFSALIATM